MKNKEKEMASAAEATNVVDLAEERAKVFAELFVKNVEVFKGPHHMQFYLGNGKDAKVYMMHDPDDDRSGEHDHIAVKVWEEAFRFRDEEIKIHEAIQAAGPQRFNVPGIVHVDFDQGAFAMERVPGQTAYKALFKTPRKISKALFEEILQAFWELEQLGFCHNDAHTENYMFTDMEFETDDDGDEVLLDAEIWIIDFGRSKASNQSGKDLKQIQLDLGRKVVDI
jgi:tRNA A-37 threonylcarbamoyl transferase component Bud32